MTTEQILYSLEQAYLTPVDYIEDEEANYRANIKSELCELEGRIIEAEENGDFELAEELEEKYAELEDSLY